MVNHLLRVLCFAVLLLQLPMVSEARPIHDFGCESCHKPGVTFTELGNATSHLCLECHDGLLAVTDASNAMGSYPSGVTPGNQTSHMWAAPAVNPAAGARAPADPGFYSRYGGSSGKVTCSRCHDPHGAEENPKLLRLGADSAEAMCQDCHGDWAAATNHALGTHPLVTDYAATATLSPEKYRAVPGNGGGQGDIRLTAGGVGCTSCHGAHFADSNSATSDGPDQPRTSGDGYLLRADGPQSADRSALCQACHSYLVHGDGSGEQVGCLVCHGGHAYNSGNPNYYVLRDSVTTASYGTEIGLDYNSPAALDDNLKHTLWNDRTDGTANGYCEKCHGDARDIVGHSSSDVCTECHSHSRAGAVHSFEGAGCTGCHLGAGDTDDYSFGNNVTARIDQAQWNSSGHGAAGLESCSFCHGGAGHDDAANPFRLANTAGPDGPNAVCWSCHRTDSAGIDPDGSGRLPLVNSSLKADSYHHGIKHGGANNGGKFCWDCHDPHGDANLAMVQSAVTTRSDGTYGLPLQSAAVDFTAKTSGGDYARSTAPFNGICNVCHSSTAHYTATSGDGHNASSTCTTCHPHSVDNPNEAFAPAGGCVDCHAGPQDNGDGIPLGGRRAMVGEFPLGNAHAHYGSELNDDACLVCHSTATHMNGTVELVDPDSGALYSFVQPADLTSDPDLSDFCGNCHDADRAARLATPLDPFGNGNLPPNVTYKFKGTLQWNEYFGDYCFGMEGTLRPSNSHHDISDADQAFGSSKIECLNCHGAHNAAASQPFVDPFDTTTPWAGGVNGFCISCHGGGSGPMDPGLPPGIEQHTFYTPESGEGPTPNTSCGTGKTWDCTGTCTSDWEITTWGGDGTYCDDGTYGFDLNCPEFEFDYGDCAGFAPDPCIGNDCPSLIGVDSCNYNRSPWFVGISWTNSAHGMGSKRSWPGYAMIPPAPSYELDCTSCHDAHGSYSAANPAGNPYMIRDYVDGTSFVDDGGGPDWNPGPLWVYGTQGNVVVPLEDYGPDLSPLCSKCHAKWEGANSQSHGSCDACNSCHSHGRAFGENDWGSGDNTPWCP